jgi:hypothetical protein
MSKVYLLDYVAGNVRSLVNAIEKVGYTIEWVRSPEDVEKADVSHQSRVLNWADYTHGDFPRHYIFYISLTNVRRS